MQNDLKNIFITWIFLLTQGFQLKSNMINIKKFVLLIYKLIQLILLAFHVLSQVLIINTNIITVQEVNCRLNGNDKLKVFFFLINTDMSIITYLSNISSLKVKCVCKYINKACTINAYLKMPKAI